MACTCGHSEEEHGHDPKYPGSTACRYHDLTDKVSGDEGCDCIAYEGEDDDE